MALEDKISASVELKLEELKTHMSKTLKDVQHEIILQLGDMRAEDKQFYIEKMKAIDEKLSEFEEKALDVQSLYIPLWMVGFAKKWIIIPIVLLLSLITGSTGLFDDVLKELRKD